MDFRGEIITLDVGGKIFRTTQKTLTRQPDSLLAKMFGPPNYHNLYRPSTPEMKDGAYFLDLDPRGFEVILGYLRHNIKILPLGVHIMTVQVLAEQLDINLGDKPFFKE